MMAKELTETPAADRAASRKQRNALALANMGLLLTYFGLGVVGVYYDCLFVPAPEGFDVKLLGAPVLTMPLLVFFVDFLILRDARMVRRLLVAFGWALSITFLTLASLVSMNLVWHFDAWTL